MARTKTRNPAPNAARKPAQPPTSPPLPAELLGHPAAFGTKLVRASTTPWQYWPVPVAAALLAGIAYALLMRPGLNLAAQEALKAAGKSGAFPPTFLSHVANAFGTVFLTALTFLVMWGLGRLGTRPAPAKVPEVYSASFVLLLPLYLLVMLAVLFTPASAYALNPADVSAAQGQLIELQRAALNSAARTYAALAFILVALLGTLAQFGLAFFALKESAGKKALSGVLLPLLPALFVQFLGIAPLILSRLK